MPTDMGGPELIQQQVDCEGDVDAADALKVLRYVAGLDYEQNGECTDKGAAL